MTKAQLKSLQEEQTQLLEKKTAEVITDEEQSRLTEVSLQLLDHEEAEEAAEEVAKALELKKAGEQAKSKKAEYTAPEGEENFVHVSQWKGDAFDPKTGNPTNTKHIQKYGKAEFENFKKNAAALGYSFEVLYQPSK